jgi:1,2-diacylglycerol 3-alpha-glucosyltransferase
VPRSIEAKNFISQFCNNVSDNIIDHGVNLDKFTYSKEKENYFVVSSQLIERKQIDKIINAFDKYLKKYDNSARLYIMGDGDEKPRLEKQVLDLGISNSVVFTGKLQHQELITYLKRAKAMLVYTKKDNNMVSIVESIAVATPIITTSVPYNASYIKSNELGIVNDNWSEEDLNTISSDRKYIQNCLNYRDFISCNKKVEDFLKTDRQRSLK